MTADSAAATVVTMEWENAYQQCIRRILDRGERITPARDQILRIICKSGHHLTSREILSEIESSGGSASRTSVFRTLDLLTRMSILRPTYVESQTPSYVLMSADGHHGHIICPECQSVLEIEECELHDVLPVLEKRYGRKFIGHLLECYALCDTCAEHSGSNT